ncbi:MAG TPA: efflux RND transporter periplasmic adaptor subunit [Vicinamibacterales bacterium]|nr:efflux RND transporter periplasmic adaptor subunit [Vicinamibacterales bacterium]
MPDRLRPSILSILFISAVLSACGRGGDPPAGGHGRGGNHDAPVPVLTAVVVAKPMPVVVPAVGTAEAHSSVQVRAQVTGQLSAIHFAEGQDVRKGQPLFTLDRRPFEAALKQAEAVLARDTAQAKNAQSQLKRYEDLFKRGLIPRDQFETQNASAASLDATLAADQAQVESARLNLQYTNITAPISGRTGALMVHAGDLVRANDTNPMVIINEITPIYVTFSVPGRYFDEIRRFQRAAALRVDARTPQGSPDTAAPNAPITDAGDDGLTSTGTVTFIDNAVDPTTGTIKLKATFPNRDHNLWPGLFVQIALELNTEPNAIVVPATAIQASQQGQFVYVVKRDRTAEVRPVTVKRQQGAEVVIASGLSAGEIVVTDGQLRLTPGAHVTPKSAEP